MFSGRLIRVYIDSRGGILWGVAHLQARGAWRGTSRGSQSPPAGLLLNHPYQPDFLTSQNCARMPVRCWWKKAFHPSNSPCRNFCCPSTYHTSCRRPWSALLTHHPHDLLHAALAHPPCSLLAEPLLVATPVRPVKRRPVCECVCVVCVRACLRVGECGCIRVYLSRSLSFTRTNCQEHLRKALHTDGRVRRAWD